MPKKPITWMGSSKDDISDFPDPAKERVGYELYKVQEGLLPTDFKPLKDVGDGAYEIREHDDSNNEFRVVYVAKFDESIYVLHAFSKKTQKTRKADINLAETRYRAVLKLRKQK
jgi:phage-related protein